MRNLTWIFISAFFLFMAASCEKEIQKEDNSRNLPLKTTVTGVCTDETAWVDGVQYLTKGNWATFTALPAVLGHTGDDIITPLNLYAGQNKLAGLVYFYELPDGTIRIKFRLNVCSSFQDVEESVKIQGYTVPPLGITPVPGQFTTFKGSAIWDSVDLLYYVDVPNFAYYGIHLDLVYCCN